MEYLAVGLRGTMVVVFAAAAASKLSGRASFTAFVRSVRRMAVVPRPLIRPTAVSVIAAEIAIAALLLAPFDLTGTAGFGLAAGLLAAFAMSIIGSLRRGERTPCRCFGRSTVRLGPRHVVRNLLLVAACAVGTVASGDPLNLQWSHIAIAVLGGAVLGAVLVFGDDIAELFWPTPRPTGHDAA